MKYPKLFFGNKNGMHFILNWLDTYEGSGPIAKTWGEMQLWIKSKLIWGVSETSGVTWSWVDLLEFLGNSWPYFYEEEQYPINFDSNPNAPSHLNKLWGFVKLRLRNLPSSKADEEDDLFRDFLAVHDFSEAFHGASAPKLLLLRRGNQLLVATEQQEWILPFADTMSALESLGDAICNRLENLSDHHSKMARDRWHQRNTMPPIKRCQLATGMDENLLHKIFPINPSLAAANDRIYRLKAAARMLRKNAHKENILKHLLKTIDSENPSRPRNSSLVNFQNKAINALNKAQAKKSYMQGYNLAGILRKEMNAFEGKVDPCKLLSDWGVLIKEIEIKAEALDAIAIWSDNTTPIILINTIGQRSRLPTGKRSTLAHEICHILIDMDNALPTIEVCGGEVAIPIEQRADAFAAEFLLPRSEASKYFKEELAYVKQRKERDKAINRVISKLADNYDVSHEMAAWQVLRAGIVEKYDEPILNKKLKSIYNPF